MKKTNKYYKSENFFFISPKQIVLSIIIILMGLISNINCINIINPSIKFKINGDIIISKKNNNENIYTKLNFPLIYTKINEKNINFKDNNVLPTQNGELNYIDPYQHITLLDISLEEFTINSPMIIKKYPNLLFITNRTMSIFSINIENGSIKYMTNFNKKALNKNDFRFIKSICPNNKNDVLFLRIDYYIKMKYANIFNNNKKEKYNDLIWYSHYIKIVPIYPYINLKNNITYKENNDFENEDDYYIFEITENKNLNLIYSQDKDIYIQIRDIQNHLLFDNYYFGNNKRKYLFDSNINKKEENSVNISKNYKKIILLIIVIIIFTFFNLNNSKSYKTDLDKKNNNIKNINNKISPLQNNLINIEEKEKNIEKNQEIPIEKQKSPKSKSISNLSTNCSIDVEINRKLSKDLQNFSLLNNNNNNKFNSKQKNLSSGKKKDSLKNSSFRSSKRKMSNKRNQNQKYNFKNIKKYTEEEKKELNELFNTYISDLNKNTSDSVINLNINGLENEEIYKKIFSLIKSDESSSSEDIKIKEDNQENFSYELENNFLFSFDNGRFLNYYKDFQFIGKGGFGVVFKATQKIDESQCAIKIMKIDLDIKEDKEKEDLKVTQEIKSMLKFKKKNIVRYKTCWFEFNQNRIKIKRGRAMSEEQRYTPSIDFKKDFKQKGERNNKLKKNLQTSLERIQSISKEIKLAEKQNNAQKNKKRKMSIIWDSDEEESDADSLGANKNYAIKEEGNGKYIYLDDNENNIDEISENLNDENSKSDYSKNDSSKSYSSEDNNKVNEFNERDNNNNEDKKNTYKENISDSNKKDDAESYNKILKKLESSSNSDSKINKMNNIENSGGKDQESDDEYNNIKVGKEYINNQSSSKNMESSGSNEINFISPKKGNESNSLFEGDVKTEKEEKKNSKNSEEDSLEEYEEDEDLKNNSEDDGLGISKKSKKRKNKKYPIYFFIQMEYCSGCPMNYYLSHRSAIPSKRLTTYMLYQMCNAVKHIHAGKIIHRDLKPGNIFIINDYLIKIGDFGLALNSTVKEYKQGGTYLYQSPEQINNEPYDEKIDIFALGVILVELVSMFKTEFERRETLQGLKKEIYPDYLKKDHLKEYNLVKKMTRLNPKERPNINEILGDNDFNDLITESLSAN